MLRRLYAESAINVLACVKTSGEAVKTIKSLLETEGMTDTWVRVSCQQILGADILLLFLVGERDVCDLRAMEECAKG